MPISQTAKGIDVIALKKKYLAQTVTEKGSINQTCNHSQWERPCAYTA